MKKLLALSLCLLIASSVRATEAPDFNLPGLSGERVQLTTLLEKGPVLLDFLGHVVQTLHQSNAQARRNPRQIRRQRPHRSRRERKMGPVVKTAFAHFCEGATSHSPSPLTPMDRLCNACKFAPCPPQSSLRQTGKLYCARPVYPMGRPSSPL